MYTASTMMRGEASLHWMHHKDISSTLSQGKTGPCKAYRIGWAKGCVDFDGSLQSPDGGPNPRITVTEYSTASSPCSKNAGGPKSHLKPRPGGMLSSDALHTP